MLIIKNNKKGMSYQIWMILLFQFLLFAAIIGGIHDANETSIVTEKINQVFSDNSKVIFKQDIKYLDLLLNVEKFSRDYLTCENQDCNSYFGNVILDDDYLFHFKNSLLNFIGSYCNQNNYNCVADFDKGSSDSKIDVVMNLGDYKSEDSSFNLKLNTSFFSSVYSLYNSILTDKKNYFESCKDSFDIKSCVSDLYSNSDYYSIGSSSKLSDVVKKVSFCLNNVDSDCVCLSKSDLDKNYFISFDIVDNGVKLLVHDLTGKQIYSTIINTNVRFIKSSLGDYVSLSELLLSNSGFYLVPDLSSKKINDLSSLGNGFSSLKIIDTPEKRVFSFESGDSCDMKVSFQPVDNSFVFNLSTGLYDTSFVINENTYNIFFNFLKGENNVIYYNYKDSDFVAKRYVKYLEDNYLSFLSDYNFNVLRDKSLDLDGKNIYFSVSLKDYNSFVNNYDVGKKIRNSLFLLFKESSYNSLNLDKYDSENMLFIDYLKEPKFNFSLYFNDLIPPSSVYNLEIFPVKYSADDYILKFDSDSLVSGFKIILDSDDAEDKVRFFFPQNSELLDFNLDNVLLNYRNYVYFINGKYSDLNFYYTIKKDSDGKKYYEYFVYLKNFGVNKKISVLTFDNHGNYGDSVSVTEPSVEEVPGVPVCDLNTFSFDKNKIFKCSVDKSILGESLLNDYKDLKYRWVCSDDYLDVFESKNDKKPTELCSSGKLFLFVYYGDLFNFLKSDSLLCSKDSLDICLKMYGVKIYEIKNVIVGTTESLKISPVVFK